MTPITWIGIGKGAAMLVLYVVLFLIAKWARQLTTRQSIDQALTGSDNTAMAVATAGYYGGLTIVFCGAYLGPSYGLVGDLALVGGYTLLGMVLLLVARAINDALVLSGYSARHAVFNDHNRAAGSVLGANYIASALIIAGSIQGQGGGVVSALAFYALGQIALIVLARLYDRLTPYVLNDEIRSGNLAAALGYGGNLIALGIVLMAGTKGDFVSWTSNLTNFGLVVVGALFYLAIVRFFFDKLVITAHDLNEEISEDRNVGAGLLEATVAIGFAAILFFTLG